MALDAGETRKTFHWEDPLDLASRLSEEERMVADAARAYARDKLLPRLAVDMSRRHPRPHGRNGRLLRFEDRPENPLNSAARAAQKQYARHVARVPGLGRAHVYQ